MAKKTKRPPAMGGNGPELETDQVRIEIEGAMAKVWLDLCRMFRDYIDPESTLTQIAPLVAIYSIVLIGAAGRHPLNVPQIADAAMVNRKSVYKYLAMLSKKKLIAESKSEQYRGLYLIAHRDDHLARPSTLASVRASLTSATATIDSHHRINGNGNGNGNGRRTTKR